MDEVKATCGGDVAALIAFGTAEEVGEPVEACAATPDVDEGTGEDADHFVKEASALELKFEGVAVLAAFGPMNGACGSWDVLAAFGIGDGAAIGGKADEVVGALDEG